jgi:hypothetical protein
MVPGSHEYRTRDPKVWKHPSVDAWLPNGDAEELVHLSYCNCEMVIINTHHKCYNTSLCYTIFIALGRKSKDETKSEITINRSCRVG